MAEACFNFVMISMDLVLFPSVESFWHGRGIPMLMNEQNRGSINIQIQSMLMEFKIRFACKDNNL